MKTLLLIITLFFVDQTHQTCNSDPGITTCINEPLRKNLPLRIENYQNLLEFGQGQIQSVPAGTFKFLTELRILFINNNKINNLEIAAFDGLYNLEKLSIYNNLLETIPSGVFRDLRSLKNLNLGSNQITTINRDAFVGLINLEEVNLGFNRLSAIPESINTLRSLKILRISNNQLKVIPANSFNSLNRLEILNLADNAITEVQNKAFKGLSSLKDLNLKSNYLSKLNIQDILEDSRALITVELAVNSFSCNTLEAIDNTLKRKRITLQRGYYNKPGGNTYNGMACQV